MLKKLLEERTELAKSINAILDGAKSEERAMNADETSKFDELEGKITAIDKTIKAEERARNIGDVVIPEAKPKETIEQMEERAFDSFVRGIVEERADTAMTQGSNGSVVPKTISNRIITTLKDRVDFLKYADVQICNGTLSYPVYTDSNEASYIDENSGSDAANGSFTSIDLTGYTLEAISVVSKKMITNVDFDLVGFVIKQIVDKIQAKMEKEFINGTTNKISGILATTNTTTTASATAITYDELLGTKHSIKKEFSDNGVWLMKPETYTMLCKLKDSNQQPYFKDDEYKILERPVLVSDNMPAFSAGNKAIVFADLTGYTVKIAKNVEVNLLNELFARKNATGVQGLVEVDGKITDSQKITSITVKAS